MGVRNLWSGSTSYIAPAPEERGQRMPRHTPPSSCPPQYTEQCKKLQETVDRFSIIPLWIIKEIWCKSQHHNCFSVNTVFLLCGVRSTILLFKMISLQFDIDNEYWKDTSAFFLSVVLISVSSKVPCDVLLLCVELDSRTNIYL